MSSSSLKREKLFSSYVQRNQIQWQYLGYSMVSSEAEKSKNPGFTTLFSPKFKKKNPECAFYILGIFDK